VFDEGHELPIVTKDRNVLIHAGPIVKIEDQEWKLVSFMPTSSIRFEKWGASSIELWGLKMIIGKTTMGEKTRAIMRNKSCVHVSPQSVSPNLWLDSIRVEGVNLFDELGSIEAVWCFKLDKLGPFIVDIDCKGDSLFELLNRSLDKRCPDVIAMLNIPADFEYTKLY